MNLVSRLKKLDHLTGQATYGMLLWLLRVLLLLHLVPSGFWLTGRAPLLRGLPPRPVCLGGLRARVAFASFTTGYAPLQVLRLGVLAPALSWQALPYPLFGFFCRFSTAQGAKDCGQEPTKRTIRLSSGIPAIFRRVGEWDRGQAAAAGLSFPRGVSVCL